MLTVKYFLAEKRANAGSSAAFDGVGKDVVVSGYGDGKAGFDGGEEGGMSQMVGERENEEADKKIFRWYRIESELVLKLPSLKLYKKRAQRLVEGCTRG